MKYRDKKRKKIKSRSEFQSKNRSQYLEMQQTQNLSEILSESEVP